MEDYRARFVEIYNKNITRPGADRLLSWLETTDFFTAPASTRYHGACECGLVMHSLNVYDAMIQHFYTEGENAESYAICALLHDLCKANFYKVSTRNVKNDATGQWEKVPFYSVEDLFPYGHGENTRFAIEFDNGWLVANLPGYFIVFVARKQKDKCENNRKNFFHN